MTAARKARDTSQTELARQLTAMGIPAKQQTIHRIETGERPVRLVEAVALGKLLNVNIEETIYSDQLDGVTDLAAQALRRHEDRLYQLLRPLDSLVEEFEEFPKAIEVILDNGGWVWASAENQQQIKFALDGLQRLVQASKASRDLLDAARLVSAEVLNELEAENSGVDSENA